MRKLNALRPVLIVLFSIFATLPIAFNIADASVELKLIVIFYSSDRQFDD